MRQARRRLAFLASVSIPSTALPGVARAATVPGIHQSSTDVDAINIYHIATSDPIADFGATQITSSPGAAATAIAEVSCGETTTCPHPGALEQVAVGLDDASNLITVGGTQEVHATATASGATALARALIDTAIFQNAQAPNSAENEIDVSGVIDIPLHAKAVATSGDALASAILDHGILQQAGATDGIAQDSIDNEGTISIDLSATANASDAAQAFAILHEGIDQEATGPGSSVKLINGSMIEFGAGGAATGIAATAVGSIALAIHQEASAQASLANLGEIDVTAGGVATGEHAVAAGLVGTAVKQELDGSAALASFSNTGGLLIDAKATAIASADGSDYDAIAQAVDLAGIVQSISGGAGEAKVTNATSGLISIDVGAKAVATNASGTGGDAISFAQLAIGAIDQSIEAKKGDAKAQISNAGLIDVLIGASAVADGTAAAQISASHILLQQALGRTAASANLTNSGTIAVQGSATATGGADAVALARINVGISQSASAVVSSEGRDASLPPSKASAKLDNIALISLEIGAQASAQSSVNALATLGTGIEVGAAADTFASAELMNSGTIALGVAATATGQTAYAAGLIGRGIGVTAFVVGTSGTAAADLQNDGTIAMGVDAHAQGGDVIASAQVAEGVRELVRGAAGVTASAGLDNEDLIAIDVSATAQGTGTVLAFAQFGDGDFFPRTAALFQVAQGPAGAEAQITNNGTIAFAAHASVVAEGSNVENVFADARGRGGISQGAIASSDQATISETGNLIHVHTKWTPTGTANASIANNGLFSLSADATVKSSGYGQAEGALEKPIFEVAHGSQADAQIDNGGTIHFHAAASVQAGGAGYADAVIETIQQIATAMGTERFFTLTTPNLYGTATLTSAAAGPASAEIVNSGYLVLDAIAHAEAGSDPASSAALSAQAIGLVSGALQLALGTDAEIMFENKGTYDISIKASATGEENAGAFALGGLLGQNASAFADYLHVRSNSHSATANGYSHLLGPAKVQLVNDGVMMIDMVATAVGGAHVSAGAGGSAAMQQIVRGETAEASIINSGTMAVNAHVAATGNTVLATVKLGGIAQTATAISTSHSSHRTATPDSGVTGSSQQTFTFEGRAEASLANSGTIEVGASIAANAVASASVADFGIYLIQQFAFGRTATADLANTNSMTLSARGSAKAQEAARAEIFFLAPVGQVALAATEGGVASANIANGGQLSIAAEASASGATHATAVALIGSGSSSGAIVQIATGGSADAALSNTGKIEVLAQAAAAATSAAYASANIHSGIAQVANATSGDAAAAVSNKGAIALVATAKADGGPSASARATIGAGVGQIGLDDRIDNGGTFDAVAMATATGVILADADASAIGAVQLGGGTNTGTVAEQFANSGTFNVTAKAVAVASNATAHANADGLRVGRKNSFIHQAEAVDITNSHVFDVIASAKAPGTAGADAVGIWIVNPPTTTSNQGLLESVTGNPVTGAITNSGALNVVAMASDNAASNTGLSSANATGIRVDSALANLTISNSGAINVAAITANGSEKVTAYGIRVTSNGVAPPDTPGLTIDNSGDILARQSVDGGTTWTRGMAIDVSDAPNPTTINLSSSDQAGYVYGDIALRDDDDTINVSDGTTYFNGILNPVTGPEAAGALDTSTFLIGTLNIDSGGNLIMADPRITGPASMYEGPSYAYVNTLNVGGDGTLTYELEPAAGGVQPVGSYSQIFADTANLAGTLVAQITTPNGLFADSYSWQDVIDANAIDGTFDHCRLAGAYADAVLLTFGCTYDSNANVDLTLTRVAFDAVGGLNRNGHAVGSALEALYDPNLGEAGAAATALAAAPVSRATLGGAAQIIGDLFLITDAAEYNTALNQLSGSAYANYLQSFASLGVHYNDLLDAAADCEGAALVRSVRDCRTAGAFHVWGQIDYQSRKADGDSEAGTVKSKRFTGLLGLDATVGGAAIVGVSAGSVTNHTRDRQFGDSVDADGMQVGAYAAYDPGAFFLKGVTTYSWYDGDSTRHVDFTPLGGAFRGTLTGHPDMQVWTAGLHAGARVPIGSASLLTPYLNLDYVHAHLKSFAERGLDGANLAVRGGSSNHTVITAGAKWTGQLGGLVPEVDLGYRYRLGSSRSHFSAEFLGDAGNDFDIVSAAQKRGALVAGLRIGGKVGRLDISVGYDGEFNGDVTSHSASFRLVLPFRGH